jgi:hypothetical protein
MPKNSKPEVHLDEFVQAARSDVNNNQPLMFLQGYVGKSPSPDSIRLYADTSLNEYADIPAADIVHTKRITDDPLGLGGSMIWIKFPTSSNKTATAYLEGNLYDAYLVKLYELEKTKTGSSTIVAATDITKTLATDFTKPAITDFTRVLQTDFTRVREYIRLRYTRVGTRGCPPGDFQEGSFNLQGGKGYYY